MSFLLTVKKVKPQLYRVAHISVLISMYKAWENCRRRQPETKPEEPDFVASLVVNGTKVLHDGWCAVFQPHNIKIAVTGIYCHQTPKVWFDGMQKDSCELGDLLWCHIHRDKRRDVVRNAILYQAKKSWQQPYDIPSNDDQLKLYTTWPEFTYVSSGKLNRQKRNVKPATPRRGAQYLLIDERPPECPESGLLCIPGTYPIGSCIAQNQLVSHSDLGLELVHSLELLSGDTFDESNIASKEIGWSRVIWDLLSVTAEKAFKRSQSGYFTHPRGAGASPSAMDGCFCIISNPYSEILVELIGKEKATKLFSLISSKGPPWEKEDKWYDEGDEGISVILVETSESEE